MLNRLQIKKWLQVPAIGMVHLRPLPGSPGWGGDMQAVIDAALRDAHTLSGAGFEAIMVENFQDTPFYREAVPPVTIAAMARIVSALRSELPLVKFGVNVLRNDALGALAIAAACGAEMIRVNVLTGAVVTDQGLIQAEAAAVLRLRQQLCPQVRILADLQVKHGAPLAPRSLGEEARDLWHRAGADAVIISGSGTGAAADAAQAIALREILPDCPVLVGSGMSTDNLPDFAGRVDGFIVGTSLQTVDESGQRVVDSGLARNFIQALRGIQAALPDVEDA